MKLLSPSVFFIVSHALSASVTVNLHANWTDAPFAVQLVEAISGYDESLYIPTVKALFSSSQSEESDWDEENEENEESGENDDDFVDTEPFDDDSESTNRALYKRAISALSDTQTGFANLHLANSIFSPRIQAHSSHYATEIKPELEASVSKQCAKDSFGEKISNPLGAWVKYGSRIYCSEPDLYALQMEKFSEPTHEFDRHIGSDTDAPLLALYGNPEDERFAGMFSTLFSLAQAGNLQFVWRYVPLDDLSHIELAGYGKTLTVKKKSQGLLKKVDVSSSLSSFLKKYKKGEIFDVAKEKLAHISDMVAALALDSTPAKRFDHLSQLIKYLPVYAPHLARAEPPSNIDEVVEHARKNEKMGASRDLIGLSINGALVHRLETDLPYIISKLQKEVSLIESMRKLGFTNSQAKKMLSKFALLSAYKENEYRTGAANNRYAVYKDVFVANDTSSGGVVFFNDLGRDQNYNLYSTDRHQVYVQEAAQFRRGQIPPLKENVHDIIFVLNFANRSQLKVFFAMSKMILDKGIPQQLGILPLVENEKDAKIANMFYHILEVGELTEALAFLYKYYESTSETEDELFGLVADYDGKQFSQHETIVKKYAIDEASVIVNGVVFNMRSTSWQTQMGNQIVHDVKLLQTAIQQGEDRGKSLKACLYAGSKSGRNLKITPKDPGNIRYKRISPALIDASVSFRKVVNPEQTSATFWLIGDFNSNLILEQFKQILAFMRSYNGRSTQVRVINTAQKSELYDALVSQFSNKSLKTSQLKEMRKMIGDVRIQTFSESDPAKLALLEESHIQSHQSSLLFNSRQFRLESVFDVRELQQILQYDFTQRLDTIGEILQAYPEDFEFQTITDFKPESMDDMDWYDMVTSVITESYNLEDSIVRMDEARFDFSSLSFENAIDLGDHDREKPIDILVTIDPIDAFSQKLVSLVEALRDLSFVNIRVLLQPLNSAEDVSAPTRFYGSGFVSSAPKFSPEGVYQRPETETFDVSKKSSFRSGVDAPTRWQIVRGESEQNVDYDDFTPTGEDAPVNYVLKALAIEAFVRNVENGAPVPGTSLEATNENGARSGYTMETMGYNQLRLEPGTWSLKTGGLSDGKPYDLLSASTNRYIANDDALESAPLNVFSMAGSLLHVRTRKAASDSPKPAVQQQADINVFSIASGATYEKLMAIMMLSVKAHTKKTVKFWLLEEFLSSQFKHQLRALAAAHGFQYELISYNWPLWLRQQTEAHRVVWAYKILFLDVLFPPSLERVIFVDADQIARTDLAELAQLDLEGAPYGFAPMCESRADMAGYQFWKHGYWQSVLKDDLKYHISALYVVDLVNFRAHRVGDKLRTHYQKLSSDPASLANLDQDLPNNLQRQVPIFSLAPEWLWCETWCAAASKKHAKMIDLCNDPTSSESKLARARRSVPEWAGYNAQLEALGGALHIDHDEL